MAEQTFHLGIKAIIQNEQGEVLLLKRLAREGWDLPGGRVQQGETPLGTLRREIAEETGLTELASITPQGMVLTQGPVLKQFQVNMASENITTTGLILWCVLNEDQRVILGPEHQDFSWVTRQQACVLLPGDYTEVMTE